MDMKNNFNDFPCNKCGWCCQRTPCPVGLYLGELPLSSCSHLVETKQDEFECGLILNEQNPIKKEALKELILSNTGCSHIYGPSPTSLMKELVKRGLDPKSPGWDQAKENTINEYQKMIEKSSDPQSIEAELNKFINYCKSIESVNK